MQPVHIDDLKTVIALTDLAEEHLQWLIDHSEYREYADGELVARYGEPAEVRWICLEGKVEDINEIEIAETFSEYGFSYAELEVIAGALGREAFTCSAPWLENLISSKKIIKDLAEASSRISNLVSSIKSHVHMDRTSDLQPTDLHKEN